jgi:hypothetical protein
VGLKLQGWGGGGGPPRCSFFSELGLSESKVQGLFLFVVVTVGREEEESML